MSTNCVSPPELDDMQLLAYLDYPDANQDTARHIAQCPYCREKTKALDRFQKRLTTRLYRSTCPSPTELGEYHLHMASASQRLVIAQHLRECPHCARELSELERFLSDMAPQPGPLEPIKVLVARLVSVGAQAGSTQAFPALRGKAKGPLVFQANGIVITVDIQSSSNGQISILGQVAADDQDQWTGAVVKLQQADKPELVASLDDLGAFAIEAVPSGSIELKITTLNNVEIQIPKIDIAT